MKNLMTISLMTLTVLTGNIKAQNQEKAAVINVHTDGTKISSKTAESLLRIEVTKTEFYKVYDKQDLNELGRINEIDYDQCVGKKCLQNVGTLAEVDKIFTGSS